MEQCQQEPTLSYKVLAARPMMDCTISIQNAVHLVHYPHSHTIGKINNSPAVPTLTVSLVDSPALPETIPNTKGIHEVCLAYSTGQVAVVLTIELGPYFGDDIFDQSPQQLVQRVVLFNLHYLHSVKPMPQSPCIRLVIGTDAECGSPIYNRKHSTSNPGLRALTLNISGRV